MIKVNSRIKLNMPKINQLTQAQITALEQTADLIRERVRGEQVVPRDTGTLQNEGFFVDNSKSSFGKVSLVHSTPYARRLYFHPEYHFQTHENPNAKGKWFEDWEPGGKKENQAQEAYKRIYRRLAGL